MYILLGLGTSVSGILALIIMDTFTRHLTNKETILLYIVIIILLLIGVAELLTGIIKAKE